MITFNFIFTISLICITWLLISKRLKHNDKVKVMSQTTKLETELAIMVQERRDYASFVSHLLEGSIDLLDDNVDSNWEKEFCQSIVRNQGVLKDARLKDTGSAFSHAINILRTNYKDVEKTYYNKMYYKNYKITEQVVYGCLDGDKESLLIMFSSIIKRTEAAASNSSFDEGQMLAVSA